MTTNGDYIEYSILELDELRHKLRMRQVEVALSRYSDHEVSAQTLRIAKLVTAELQKERSRS